MLCVMALIHFVFMKKGIHKIEMRSKWIGVQWLAWIIVILIIYFKQSWLVRLWSIFLAIKHRFRIIYVFINEYSNCFFDYKNIVLKLKRETIKTKLSEIKSEYLTDKITWLSISRQDMGTGVSNICIMDDYQTIGYLFQEIYVNINNGSKHSSY